MNSREILDEWLKGCGNTTPSGDPPWKCDQCTEGMMGALDKAIDRDALALLKALNPITTELARGVARAAVAKVLPPVIDKALADMLDDALPAGFKVDAEHTLAERVAELAELAELAVRDGWVPIWADAVRPGDEVRTSYSEGWEIVTAAPPDSSPKGSVWFANPRGEPVWAPAGGGIEARRALDMLNDPRGQSNG